MDSRLYRCFIISDFNISNFAACLQNDTSTPPVKPVVAQFFKTIVSSEKGQMEEWCKGFDFSVVWTQPEAVIPSFAQTLRCEIVSLDKILKEVDAFFSSLEKLRRIMSFIFVPTWLLPSHQLGWGILNMKNGLGLANTLMRMNLRLCDNAESQKNVFVLNSQKWLENTIRCPFNPRLWYTAKIPFDNEVFLLAAKDVKSALTGLSGRSRKIIILDLDDTLWGGLLERWVGRI